MLKSNSRAIGGSFLVAAMCCGCATHSNVSALPGGGEKAMDQRQSVVYVRGVRPYAESRDMYMKLQPDSLMMPAFSSDPLQAQKEMAEAAAWGCRYRYDWFNPTWIYQVEQNPPKPGDPAGDVTSFTKSVWDRWDEFRAAGVVSGERPKNLDDLLYMPREYAMALKAGTAPPANAKLGVSSAQPKALHLRLTNPDVRRIMTDITKYRASHGFGQRFNAFFADLGSGTKGGEDWSDHSQRAFDAWVRARYTDAQIRAIFQTDPAQLVPMWPPVGASGKANPDLTRIYNCMTRRFFSQVLGDHFRALKEAAESVLGKDHGGFLINATTFGWRSQNNVGADPLLWGDAAQSYCSEAGIWPGMGGIGSYGGLRVPDVRNNLFDFQFGAARLWGEPVMVKPYFYDAANPSIVQLGLAEGLALLGNMGLYAHPGEVSSKVTIPGAWASSMAEFAHTIAPQVRQMIPAGEVGVLFSSVDFFCGFDENYRQVYETCEILQRLHVPFQIIHLDLLESHLNERPVKAIVMPSVRCLSDAHIRQLGDFLRSGGKLVQVGECGAYTWEGVKRERPATFGRDSEDVSIVPSQLSGGAVRSHEDLRRALSPGPYWAVRSDKHPALLVNLTRNSNNSRFWMHLLNYDVDMDAAKGAANPVRAAEDVRVIVPLPAGLRAASAKLFRPNAQVEELPVESGTQGCAVIVPRVDIYALVEVATEAGPRPRIPLREELPQGDTLSNVSVPSAKRKFVTPPCPLPEAAPGKAQRYVIGTTAYVTVDDRKAIAMDVKASSGSFPVAYTVYAMDGRPVASATIAGEKTENISVPEPGAYAVYMQAGMKRYGVIGDGNADYAVRFVHKGGAVIEASRATPLNLRREKGAKDDAAVYYFYVPKACRAFKLFADTTASGPFRLVVRDSAGKIALDRSEDFRFDKPLECKPAGEDAGRVWSLTIDQTADGKRKYSTLYLDGVPPVLAETPSQLLIAQGDE
jgi:hypothetical protein